MSKGTCGTITLKNDFHNTKISLKRSSRHRLSPGQVRLARATLCGVAGCRCGGNAGERGPQHLPDGVRCALIPTEDGGCDIEIG
jgi:hypothetical protein